MAVKKSVIGDAIADQRAYFRSGITLDPAFRMERLMRLREVIMGSKVIIYEALMEDLHKPKMEAYASEIGIVLDEISFTARNLKKWARPRNARTPRVLFPARSVIYHEPRGVVLIMSPWNYPFQLLLSPLVAALAAGNVAVLKPSEFAPATSRVLVKIVQEAFEPQYVSIFPGGVDTGSALLRERFDHIFYTGNTAVGRIVMEAASRNLTPVTLELGGKSPCIVDETASLEIAARRIVWGKLINAGQTCIAPDYLLVKKEIREEFMALLMDEIKNQYGENAGESPDYCRIINDRHFRRLSALIDKRKVVYGGRVDKKSRFIEPTILDNVDLRDAVMKEEIFGPILPVIPYSYIHEAMGIINSMEKPLALYLFSNDRKVRELVMERVSFGGGCVNDTAVHFANPFLPFGGVGNSGMGSYHGEAGFRAFSHSKGVVVKSNLLDLALRYAPYSGKKLDLISRILK